MLTAVVCSGREAAPGFEWPVVDEVRRRVQQDTLGRRGQKNDPLYKIRGLLRHGVEHLSDRQQAKLTRCFEAGDPDGEVDLGLAVLPAAPLHPPQQRRPGSPDR
jgi:hypothetical protein